MQQSMFGGENNTKRVLTVKQPKNALSKNQQAFNRLTIQIADLRTQIEADGQRLLKLSTMYNAEIPPVIVDLGKQKIILAKKLAAVYKTVKLTSKQKNEVEAVIFDLLDDAFVVIIPDEETQKLYNDFSGKTYDEALLEQREELKDDLQEQFFDVFGLDINMDDYEDSAEGYARLQEQLRQKIGEQHGKEKRKKTKKQLAKESELQKQEEIKKRSIRSIYMSLAKLLHPDTEVDETVKKEKEEVMKELTRAYTENDLPALLKLELQWLATENDHLEKLSDDTLKIYIAVLRSQVKELQTEKEMQLNNPAFQPLLQFLHKDHGSVVSMITYEKKERLRFIERMKEHTLALEGGKLRAAIKECIAVYLIAEDENGYEDTPSFQDMMEILMRNRGRKR
ncbi:MAG: hypothetical protein ABJB86_09285 [Bacteroidota bacterium]